MRLPTLLFAFAAFFLGSVLADVRPPAAGDACSSGQNTGCFCSGGCAANAQAYFSCFNGATSTPITDIGIRFEAGYAQPSQTRSWQISNNVGWPNSAVTVDLFQQTSTFGTAPGTNPSPTPNYNPVQNDQWLTGGVNALTSANPTGPSMWACTRTNLLARSNNAGFGPAQPRCVNPATGVITAPWSQGCQESLLFDGPQKAVSVSYRGWAYAGIKVRTGASTYTYDDPGSLTLIPSSGLSATELRALPGKAGSYSGGGVTMNCFVSLWSPCNACAAGQVCAQATITGSCVTGACCPPDAIVKPPTGPWFCCPAGTAFVQPPTGTGKCCPSNETYLLDVDGNCCPRRKLVNQQQGTTCCPDSQYFGVPGSCCATALTNGQCCPATPAGPFNPTLIPSGHMFNPNVLPANTACCPANVVNDQTGANLACCPAAGMIYVNVNLRSGTVNQFCCPADGVINNQPVAGQKVCCPGPAAGTTYTTLQGSTTSTGTTAVNQCCPTANLAVPSGSCLGSTTAICCTGTGVGATSCISADNRPCCPTNQVLSVPDTAGASAPHCCPNYQVGAANLVWFSAGACCHSAWIVTPPTTGVSGPTGSLTNGKLCCTGGMNANAAPTTGKTFACTQASIGDAVCTWTTSSACCDPALIRFVGASATPTTQYCCPAGTYYSCTNAATCPRELDAGAAPNPCCPTSQGTSTCSNGQVFCCPGAPSNNYACVSTAASGAPDARCCPAANRPQVGSTTALADYCCQDSQARVFISATIPCCLRTNIPVTPGPNPSPVWDQCCTSSGANPVFIAGIGCCQASAVASDGAGGFQCCEGIGANPVYVPGTGCCAGNRDLNGIYCCPAQNGRNVAVGAQCPGNVIPTPPASQDCWINGANCAAVIGGANPCCCYAGVTARSTTNGDALPSTPICCAAGNTGGPFFYVDASNPCCTTPVATWRPTLSSPAGTEKAHCCPANPAALGGAAISGVTCDFYTTVTDASSGNAVQCCRNCDVGRNFATNTPITDATARCCASVVQASQVPTKVDAAPGLSSSYLNCCPRNQVLQTNLPAPQPALVCCPSAASGFAKFVGGVCCPANQDTVNPNDASTVCCPNTVNSPVTWANLGADAGSCCAASNVLIFTSATVGATVLPNVPFTNATSGTYPNYNQKNVFCCPQSQLTVGAPTADRYIPAVDAVTVTSNVNIMVTNYDQLRCCPRENVIRVLATNNKVYDVCCPGSGMVWNNVEKRCCTPDVFSPACPTPAPLAGCAGTCCGSGVGGQLQGAVKVGTNGIVLTGQTQCCGNPSPPAPLEPTAGNIIVYQGTSYCCPPSLANKTPTPAYRNDGTFLPCCAAADTIDCNIAACTITARPYKMCCPATSFPAPPPNSGNPPIIIDPQTGLCCKGWLNSAGLSAAFPGGNKCCPPVSGFSSSAAYREAADNPCCTTLIDPVDFTCCPAVQFHAGTPPSCCKSDEAWVDAAAKCCPIALATAPRGDGTYAECCDQPGYVADPGHTCCLATTLQNGYCCPPEQLDSNGICCPNNTIPDAQFIDLSTGQIVVINNTNNANGLTQCCLSGQRDCANYCYFLDFDGVLKAFHVQGSDGGCCPESALDCAGACPNADGTPKNTGVPGDCCPLIQRGCANGVPNTGACGAADTNCCEQYSGTNCTSCIGAPGCGWCNQVGSSDGLCLSGDYFAPTAGVEGRVCNATAGYRWTAVGTSKIFLETNGFNDGRSIEFANVSVLLAKNVPYNVTFKIKAPADLPLDVYFLQDRTNSFIQPVSVGSTYIPFGPLDVLKSNLDELDRQVNALVPSGYHLGFGTFGDKGVEPFGYWFNSGYFDFVFKNTAAIGADRASVIAAIKNLDPNTFAGGNDIPEASLEALLHVAQDPNVNWGTTRADSVGRQKPVNKICIVVTDAPAHTATTQWPAGSTYAPDTQFPASSFPLGLADKDLGYYLSSDPTVASAGAALQPPQSWRSSTGSYLDTTNCAGVIRQPVAAYDATRQGICYDYPSKAQGAQAIATRGFTTVFAVADTVSSNYPVDAGRNFWGNFSVNEMPAAGATPGVMVRLDFNVNATGPGGLVYEIVAAIQRITQGITFENTSSSQFLSGDVVSQFILPPGGIQIVTVPLLWDGTDYGSSGPFPIDFQAIFPLSGYQIDVARINVYISPEKRCCFCGDGKVDPEPGCDEQCDNDGSTDPTCCKSCKLQEGAVCANDVLCFPVICNATGSCVSVDLNQQCTNDINDPLAFCQFNSCLAGACVVQCNSDQCCNDNDNCTDDVCILDLSLCSYTLKDECDCSNSAYNNCFDCVRNNNTKCAYEANSGSCFQFNETTYQFGGYGPGINPVTDEKGIAQFCVVGRDKNGKTGVIVGSIFGALAALGLIALAAALWWRLKNGPLLAPGGTASTAGEAGAASVNPIYTNVNTMNNPLSG